MLQPGLGEEREKQREESCGEVLEKAGRPMAAINQHSLQRECLNVESGVFAARISAPRG